MGTDGTSAWGGWSDFEIGLERNRRPPAVEDGRKEGGKYRIVFDKGVVGSINGGGPEIQFKTVNGNIRMLINRGGGYKNMRYLLLKSKRMVVTNTEYVAFLRIKKAA